MAHIKKDLSNFGMADAVVCSGNMYAIGRTEFACDFEFFENIAADFQ